jgi:hypothetical protein
MLDVRRWAFDIRGVAAPRSLVIPRQFDLQARVFPDFEEGEHFAGV